MTISRSRSKFKLQKAVLSNGLTLLHLETKNDPVAACHLFLPGGAALETKEKAGLTSLHWSLMLKGTRKRSARQLAEDIESIGASIGAGATHDYSEISCHAAADTFLPTLNILAETLFEPSFIPEEMEKEKAALIAAIRSKKENIFSVASDEFNSRLYGDHPYGRPAIGNEHSIASFSSDNLERWHESLVIPNGAVLATASPIPFSKLRPKLTALFGPSAWPGRKGKKAIVIPKTSPPTKTGLVQLHESFEQAYLLMGFPAPDILSRDYMTIKVLSACLGGGMSTRLFQELREKGGLAYDVGSFYPSKMNGSAFVIYMGLQKSRLEEAKKKINAILNAVRKSGIGPEELNQIKNYLKGTYLLDHQTNSQRAHYVGWWHVLGRGGDFDRKYLKAIDSVSQTQIIKAAQSILRQKPVMVEIHPLKTPRSLVHAQ